MDIPADDFLGTQGDPWDTQTDMFAALVGSLCALFILTRWHDRSVSKLNAAPNPLEHAQT